MSSVAKYVDSDQLQATCTLKFIQLQLLDLAKDCDTRVQSGLVSSYYFVELQNKLEKLLHETRAAWNPPLRKPERSDFSTVKSVGCGGFGTVNLVRHRETGQAFAMKLIKRQSLTTPSHVQQVLVERDILTFTDNPFIVSMFCSFETQEDLCLVMEYAGGGDCAALLKHYRRLPVDMARRIVAETVLAVEYLHSYGILHRDLKPSNLLISSSGHVKVTDFGLSKIGPVTMTADMDKSCINKIVREFTDKVISGTAAYIAPEVVVRQGYGKPVDWWAVGIILYEFLLGSPPFSGRKVKEILYNVVKSKIIWPQEGDSLPANARDLIRHLLKKKCEKRLGTRGACEVKAHPFFQDVGWSDLLDQDPLFVPPTDDDKSSNGDESSDDGKSTDVNEESLQFPDFCYVAFRFRKVYGSPAPLSPFTFFKQSLLSTKPGHSMVEEEQEDEGYEEQDSDNLNEKEDDEKLLTSSDSAEQRQARRRRRKRGRRRKNRRRGKRRGKKRRRCKGRRRRIKGRRRRKKGHRRRRRQRGGCETVPLPSLH